MKQGLKVDCHSVATLLLEHYDDVVNVRDSVISLAWNSYHKTVRKNEALTLIIVKDLSLWLIFHTLLYLDPPPATGSA